MSLPIIYQSEVFGKLFQVYGTPENPLFLARDVAEWIEHSNPTEMLRSVDEDEKLNSTILSAGQRREVSFLTEQGLYEVLMLSRKPIAKQFKKQVKAILVEIRKTGAYTVDADQTAAIINAQIVDIGKRQLRGEEIPPSLLNYVSRLLSFLGALPTQSGRKEADPPWMTAIIRTAENLAPKVRYSRRDVYRMYTDNCKDCGVSPLSERAFWQSLRTWRPFQDIRSANERMITFWED